MVRRAIVAHEPCAIEAKHHLGIRKGIIDYELVKRTLHERRVNARLAFPPSAKPLASATACSSAIPVSINRFRNFSENTAKPVPSFIAAVMATISWSRSASATIAFENTLVYFGAGLSPSSLRPSRCRMAQCHGICWGFLRRVQTLALLGNHMQKRGTIGLKTHAQRAQAQRYRDREWAPCT